MCGRSSPSLSLSDVVAFRGTGLLFLYFHLNVWTSGGKEAQRDDQLFFIPCENNVFPVAHTKHKGNSRKREDITQKFNAHALHLSYYTRR